MAEKVMFDMRIFEDSGNQNGVLSWKESDLRKMLEYANAETFRRVIFKAMKACLSLNINTNKDFILKGKEYSLTRFACYLICMNADSRKKPVALAQGYFAALADFIHSQQHHAELIDRVVIREEVRDGMKSLAATAESHGVKSFALFMDAGYRGMYNMSMKELEEFKGHQGTGSILDRMGRMELAANLLRVTMTDARVNEGNIRGQQPLEEASLRVGKIVRDAIISGTGVAPEHIPLTSHIKEAEREIKNTEKRMRQLSTPAGAEEVRFLLVENNEDEGYTPDPEEEIEDPEPPSE